MTQIVVITGSSSGIGFSIAQRLSENGHRVYGLSRSIPEGGHFTTITTDVNERKSLEESIRKIIEKEKRIDVLINNAGRGMVGAVEDATDEEVHELFQLNVLGVIHGIQSVMPYFRNQQKGTIINISSIGSVMGLPFRGYYSASKAAVDKLTEALRYEVNEFGVTACVLHLGDIATNIAQNRIKTAVSKPYESTFNKVYESMNTHVNQGTPAEEVSKFVEQLMGKNKLKAHYYLGKPAQKLSVSLKKFLPQNAFEALIKKYSDL